MMPQRAMKAHLLGHILKLIYQALCCLLDAADNLDRVSTGSNHLDKGQQSLRLHKTAVCNHSSECSQVKSMGERAFRTIPFLLSWEDGASIWSS
jgi:hypothetical protein